MGYPWVAETVAVAWKHENVHIDTSVWSPKYYAPEFIQFGNTTGRRKVMFGTNFPQLGLKDCVDQVNTHLFAVRGGFRDASLKDFMGGECHSSSEATTHEIGETWIQAVKNESSGLKSNTLSTLVGVFCNAKSTGSGGKTCTMKEWHDVRFDVIKSPNAQDAEGNFLTAILEERQETAAD
ncbi:hypothetical protein Q7P35_012005 [Cladosporium inversicolor]